MTAALLLLFLWAQQTPEHVDHQQSTGPWIIPSGCHVEYRTTDYSEVMCDKPKPEPMDVPAVQEAHRGCVWSGEVYASSFSCPNIGHFDSKGEAAFFPDANGNCGCGMKMGEWKEWTCADRSRILLKSLDGKGHCLKFPKED